MEGITFGCQKKQTKFSIILSMQIMFLLHSINAQGSCGPPTGINCGQQGNKYFTRQTCLTNQDCCWNNDTNPNCYYKATAKLQEPQCAIEAVNRVDCGNPRSNSTTCYASGCCWNATVRGIWCFRPLDLSKTTLAPTTTTTTLAPTTTTTTLAPTTTTTTPEPTTTTTTPEPTTTTTTPEPTSTTTTLAPTTTTTTPEPTTTTTTLAPTTTTTTPEPTTTTTTPEPTATTTTPEPTATTTTPEPTTTTTTPEPTTTTTTLAPTTTESKGQLGVSFANCQCDIKGDPIVTAADRSWKVVQGNDTTLYDDDEKGLTIIAFLRYGTGLLSNMKVIGSVIVGSPANHLIFANDEVKTVGDGLEYEVINDKDPLTIKLIKENMLITYESREFLQAFTFEMPFGSYNNNGGGVCGLCPAVPA